MEGPHRLGQGDAGRGDNVSGSCRGPHRPGVPLTNEPDCWKKVFPGQRSQNFLAKCYQTGGGGVWVGIPVTLWMSGQVRDVAASRLTFFHSLRSFHCHHFKTLFRRKINRCSIALVQLPENSENQQMKLNNLFKLKYINKRIPICLMQKLLQLIALSYEM